MLSGGVLSVGSHESCILTGENIKRDASGETLVKHTTLNRAIVVARSSRTWCWVPSPLRVANYVPRNVLACTRRPGRIVLKKGACQSQFPARRCVGFRSF
jgi:hypothetical protein